jgi:N-acetylglucosaminyl-diphospho-decaprenol L-rhamnosyltransferase
MQIPLNIFAVRTGLNRILTKIKMTDDANWNPKITQNCDWVPGCYYLIRKQVIDEVGLFDPIYFLYYEEVDHCLAAKNAGWKVTYFAETTAIHIGGESAKSDGKITSIGKQLSSLQVESELLFFRKNYGLLTCLCNIGLVVLADLLEMSKLLVQFKFPKDSHFFAASKLMIACAIKTRFGSKPVR